MPITRIGTYSQIQGTSFKLPCRVATTAAITLSGTQTIDGVAVVAGDRVLVKDQGTGSDNGIYIVAASTWSRAVDMSIDEDMFEGLMVYVNSGTANGDKTFYLNTANPITLGVTSLTFTAVPGGAAIGGTVTGGTTGSVLFVDPTATLAQDNANFFWDNTNNRLGIGTTSPAYKLEVSGTLGVTNNSNATVTSVFQNTNTTNTNTRQQLDITAGNVTLRLLSIHSDHVYINPTTAVNTYIGHNNTLTLLSGGNVGIGTTTPARGLSIFDNTIGLYSSTTGQGLTDGYTMELGGTTAYLWNYENDSLIFGTNNSERMRITSGGQLKLNNYTSTSAFTGTAVGYLGFDSSGNILSSAVPAGSTITLNRQAASYTLVLADAGKLVEMNVGTANNLTVPLNSSVAFPIGTTIDVSQYGAGQTTFVATGGVTIRSTNGWLKMNAQYGAATLVKIATDEWYLFGNINA